MADLILILHADGTVRYVAPYVERVMGYAVADVVGKDIFGLLIPEDEGPGRGLVSPVEFIPVAEQTGLIRATGGWVLREACLRARAWQGELPPGSRLVVSVNLSAAQLKHPGFVVEVARAIEETGVDPGSLILEITESMLMEDAEGSVETLCGLNALGVRVALDDFGTACSSLASLKRFPIDTLKVDRAFVDGLGSEAGDTAIVRAVMGLARALGLEVVAEGIETAEQLDLLRDLGCDYGRGYYFAKPLPDTEAGGFLARTHLAVGARGRPRRVP